LIAGQSNNKKAETVLENKKGFFIKDKWLLTKITNNQKYSPVRLDLNFLWDFLQKDYHTP
jgi:hypothetical protein